jgi:hypothetical protein
MSSQNCQENGKPVVSQQLNETATADELAACTHAARAVDGQVGGEVELDTVPSNTVSNKYPDTLFKPLRWGIDSLYLSFTGQLSEESEKELSRLKSLAQSDMEAYEAQARIELNGHSFEVKDKGSGIFPFVIVDNCFRIGLSKRKAKSVPMAYVQVSSEYLTHRTVEDILDDLRKVLRELGSIDYMPKVSRIDLFVDFASQLDMESWDRHAWVTRASSIHQYSVDGTFTGWMIGQGSNVSGRLYNKLVEIVKSGKAYLVPLWEFSGWNATQDGPVWRMEFQFRREVLSQFNIQLLDATLNHRNGLWSYATTEWLKLTEPSEEDQNRSRWPVHPLWQGVASVDFESYGGPLSRQFSACRMPSEKELCKRALSVLTTYMAKEGISDFHQGMEGLARFMVDYLKLSPFIHSQADFDLFIQDRVAVKARQYNVVLDDVVIHDPVIERALDDYLTSNDLD